MDAVLAFIQSLTSSVAGLMGIATVIGGFIEVLLRLIPSTAPRSLIVYVAKGFNAVGALCVAIGGFLDKVLPQVLKSEKPDEKI